MSGYSVYGCSIQDCVHYIVHAGKPLQDCRTQLSSQGSYLKAQDGFTEGYAPITLPAPAHEFTLQEAIQVPWWRKEYCSG